MYTRIALGKNAAMDVVSGESSGGYGQMLILYPMLFALQAFQLLIGGNQPPPPPPPTPHPQTNPPARQSEITSVRFELAVTSSA